MIFETLATFIFVLTILISTSTLKNELAGLIIRITLATIRILGIPITGVSVNPARSLGSAIFVGGTSLLQLWIFVVFPIIGAFFAAITYRLIFSNK